MKIPKFKVQMKVILMIITTIIAVFLIRLLLIGGLVKLLSFDSQRTEVYKDTDITHYQWYIGKNAKKEYADKWGMDESIFPESITDNMDVLDYKMVYYNPWDAQYLSYLVVEYDDKSYEEGYRDWSNMIQKNIKDILEREVFGISTVFWQ